MPQLEMPWSILFFSRQARKKLLQSGELETRVPNGQTHTHTFWAETSVTILGILLEFGPLFKAFGNN